MSLFLKRWQEQFDENVQTIGATLEKLRLEKLRDEDKHYPTYRTLIGLALFSLVKVAKSITDSGKPLPIVVYLALGTYAGETGSNLIADQLKQWIDTENQLNVKDIEEWVHTTTIENPELHFALGSILEHLNALKQAENYLSPADRQWFVKQFNYDQKQIYSASISADGGAVAAGNNAIAASGGSIIVKGNVSGNIIINNDNSAFPKESLLKAYLNRLLHDAGYLALSGVDPVIASHAEQKLGLQAIYTALLTTEEEGESNQPSRRSALEQLNQYQHIVLLGEPGSGKSTFINFVALCMGGEFLQHEQINLKLLTAPLPDEKGQPQEKAQIWEHGALLPVRVILRDFAIDGLPGPEYAGTVDHLWNYISYQLPETLFEYNEPLRQHLLDQGGIILLDGLDEVPDAENSRVQIKQAIEDFRNTFANCRIIVTSRTYAYQRQDWQLEQFNTVQLSRFSIGQIRQFVDRWYAYIGKIRHFSEEDSQEKAMLLKDAIYRRMELLELAERPILLTLMASLHVWRAGELPDKREELYCDTVDLLLHRWEKQQKVRSTDGTEWIQPGLLEWLKIGWEQMRGFLNQLAYEAHSEQREMERTANISELKLITGLLGLTDNQSVQPRRLIEYLRDRAGVIQSHGVGVYTFPHRSFQEYLAACYLTDRDFPDRVADLGRKEPDRWREVVLLAGAKSARDDKNNLWTLIEALSFQPVSEASDSLEAVWGAHLAGQLLAEVVNLSDLRQRHLVKLNRIKEWLLHIIRGEQLPSAERVVAGQSLAQLGDPRREVIEVDLMQFCYVPEGVFWMGNDTVPYDERKWVQEIFDSEKPSHEVNLPYSYWIGKYPVTNAQYQIFVNDGGYANEIYWHEAKIDKVWDDGKIIAFTWSPEELDEDILKTRSGPLPQAFPFNLPNHPVVGITWYEALAFCRWLANRWNKHLPTGWSVKLPSEVEWEKAARGGIQVMSSPVTGTIGTLSSTTKPDIPNPYPQRKYPHNDIITIEHANYDQTQTDATNCVGCFPAGISPYGCEELSGNIYEWTRDLWGEWDLKTEKIKYMFRYPYKLNDARGKIKPGITWTRTMRGGAWLTSKEMLRCTTRSRNVPHTSPNYYGFRIVLTPYCDDVQ